MKVYVVSSKIDYEPGSTEGVFLTEEDAREFLSDFDWEHSAINDFEIEVWETDTNEWIESFEINGPRRAERRKMSSELNH